MIQKVKFVDSVQENYFITCKDNNMKFCAKNYIIFKSVRFSYSFSEMNKFMTSKIVVRVFRSKLDVSENRYTLILKSVNIIRGWK